jgi:hypothetical protein
MTLIPKNQFKIASLPPELIRDNFVRNYRKVSYEEYLTELVNCSNTFLNLSRGGKYIHTAKSSQKNRECDCCSDYYELDFKLLGAQSSMCATNTLSSQKVYTDGKIIALLPRRLNGMEVSRTAVLLRQYSLDNLNEINERPRKKMIRARYSPECDVKSILDVAKCKKNVMFFYKDFFFSDGDYKIEDIVQSIEPYINDCFANLFRFRDGIVNSCDTFLAVIIQGYFCIANWKNGRIHFCEYLPPSNSSVFVELYNIADAKYKNALKII